MEKHCGLRAGLVGPDLLERKDLLTGGPLPAQGAEAPLGRPWGLASGQAFPQAEQAEFQSVSAECPLPFPPVKTLPEVDVWLVPHKPSSHPPSIEIGTGVLCFPDSQAGAWHVSQVLSIKCT